MQMLTTHLVPQQEDYVTPFNRHTPGYRPHWWVYPFQERRRTNDLPYSFIDQNGDEVARALLREQAGFTDLEGAGVSIPRSAIAVDRIEVREDLLHPRRGIGTNVIRLIETLHPSDTLYAFSEQADDFWRSTGWEFMPRIDGDEGYRPLFVLRRD